MSSHEDIDGTFDNLEKQYNKVTNQFEAALLMHKLAADYYRFRAFWFIFIPLTLISCFVTIESVIIFSLPNYDEDEAEEDDYQSMPVGQNKLADTLAIITALLSAFSTFLTTLGKYQRYQSKCDMHENAILAIEKLCLSINFEKDHFSRSVLLSNNDMRGPDLKFNQTTFRALQGACDSVIPGRVIQAFTVLEETVGMGRGYKRELIFYYHKLWKEISCNPLWPLFQPSRNFDVLVKYQHWRMQFEDIRQSDRSILVQEP